MELLKNKFFIISVIVIGLILAVAGLVIARDITSGDLGLAEGDTGGGWVCNSGPFTGYETLSDPSKVSPGANPQGQNTVMNIGDRISVRDLGYEIFPSGSTASTTATGIQSLHTFRKRSGENLFVRGEGTVVEFYDETQDIWEVIKTGLTSGNKFGFADYNINTDLLSYVYFGNGVNDFMRWTGAHTNLNGALTGGEATIIVDDTIDGFATSGTIILCGVEVTYSGKTATTFTGASGTPACADNRAVVQAVETNALNPKGNIYAVHSNRLFISGVSSTPQAAFFSQYGDAMTFTTTSLVTDGTATDSGIFNLGEGGGGVTAMAQDENALYIFKRSIIYKATLTDALYTVLPLKPFDGKSQTTGAINQDSVFAGGNGIFFITPDRQIMNLTRVESVDYPQMVPISHPIEPTVEAARFASSTGIFYQNKAYISAKADTNSSVNDVVFVYNFERKGWESPIVGWNVADWTIYDDGTGEKLYFGNTSQPNVYLVNNIPLDDIYGVTANWRSKEFDFGFPSQQKEISNFFVEGYIADNTTLNISLLLDDNGFTQIFTTALLGTETSLQYAADSFNMFGFHPFGTERFGSGEVTSKKKFRTYLNKDLRRTPLYTAQVEFASDGENQQWEVLRYCFQIREATQPENRTIYRKFN